MFHAITCHKQPLPHEKNRSTLDCSPGGRSLLDLTLGQNTQIHLFLHRRRHELLARAGYPTLLRTRQLQGRQRVDCLSRLSRALGRQNPRQQQPHHLLGCCRHGSGHGTQDKHRPRRHLARQKTAHLYRQTVARQRVCHRARNQRTNRRRYSGSLLCFANA